MTDLLAPSASSGALSPDLSGSERRELDDLRAAFRAIADVCSRASHGDLEARVPMVSANADVVAVRHSVNHLLDMTDAFVREAAAALHAAAEGRYHRAFLVHGMQGSFRNGARSVNEAREAVRTSNTDLKNAQQARLTLADEFERVVLAATEQVASASTELGATAGMLTQAADASVKEVVQAAGTIAKLDESSHRIREVVTLINQVAAQTRLLALNATIEAARAGEAGKGFAVVAHEVKELAGQTAAATSRIEQEVSAVQLAASQSGRVLEGIGTTVHDMHQQVLDIAAAVDGAHGAGVTGYSGLSELAELLRDQMTMFLASLRA